MQEARERKLKGHPEKVVEEISNKFRFTQGEQGGVLRYLIDGLDLSQYGVGNAVTRMSQDVEFYDRATELEAVGGKIFTMPTSSWTVLDKVA